MMTDLGIPPPTQEGAVGDPRLDVLLGRHLQPGPDHVAQRVDPRVVVDYSFEISIATRSDGIAQGSGGCRSGGTGGKSAHTECHSARSGRFVCRGGLAGHMKQGDGKETSNDATRFG